MHPQQLRQGVTSNTDPLDQPGPCPGCRLQRPGAPFVPPYPMLPAAAVPCKSPNPAPAFQVRC